MTLLFLFLHFSKIRKKSRSKNIFLHCINRQMNWKRLPFYFRTVILHSLADVTCPLCGGINQIGGNIIKSKKDVQED